MGSTYNFLRSHCGYQADVSGTGDAGFSVCTQTILCHGCKELYDVPTAIIKSDYEQQIFPDVKIIGEEKGVGPAFLLIAMHCPKDPGHAWSEWNCPDACPRCGSLISGHSDGFTTLWD